MDNGRIGHILSELDLYWYPDSARDRGQTRNHIQLAVFSACPSPGFRFVRAQQQGSQQATARGVHLQKLNRCTSGCRPTDDPIAGNFKVIGPFLQSGIEQAHHCFCHGIETCEVWPLEQVAAITRQGEILGRVIATMLLGENMLDVESAIHRRLRQVAVLAAFAGTLPDQSFGRRIHQSA